MRRPLRAARVDRSLVTRLPKRGMPGCYRVDSGLSSISSQRNARGAFCRGLTRFSRFEREARRPIAVRRSLWLEIRIFVAFFLFAPAQIPPSRLPSDHLPDLLGIEGTDK